MLVIFLDIETTGLDVSVHHPIDIAFKIVEASTGETKAAYQSVIKPTSVEWNARDLNSMAINGYTSEEVQQGKDLHTVANEIIESFCHQNIARGKSLFICQNPGFDRAFFAKIIDVYSQDKLKWPYHWLDLASMHWALFSQKLKEEKKPFPFEMNFSKNSIAEYFSLPIEETPHKAINGVNHLLLCYKAVVGFPLS